MMSHGQALTRLDVVAAIGAERSLTEGSAPWTLKFVDIADRQFSGAWRPIALAGSEALEIVLPPHAGEPCRGDRLMLIGPGGATVAEAARRLARIREEYAASNPSCWGRMAGAAAAPFSTLVLTTAPIEAEDYASIAPSPGRFYHLDGFHRLVGWAWAGRLTAGVRLKAWVAGPAVPPR
jgi:hypothetical protein